uniref:Uncharacterized protein n=1 Tax=Spongospora subterranea TaxID=70186 RepID=A0A0H5REC6_9EUKA|eukprot:CRZ11892.1 hypothetical protein [Spongospora subterranea]
MDWRVIIGILAIWSSVGAISANNDKDPNKGRLAAIKALSAASQIISNQTSNSSGIARLKVPMVRNGTAKPVTIDLKLSIGQPKVTVHNYSDPVKRNQSSSAPIHSTLPKPGKRLALDDVIIKTGLKPSIQSGYSDLHRRSQ